MKKPHISVIVPVYNGAGFLAASLRRLTAFLDGLGRPYEIIVVDDGSVDGTAETIIPPPQGVRVLTLDGNRGKGAAVRVGMLAAMGRYRFFVDADLPYDLVFIEQALPCLEEKEFALVIGDRNVPGSRYPVRFSLLRRMASRLFTFVIGRIVVTGITDTQCGIKGFREESARDLFTVSRINRFAFDVEIVYLALRWNYDLKRLPVVLVSDGGSSTVRLGIDSLRAVRDVFRIKMNQKRGRYAPRWK